MSNHVAVLGCEIDALDLDGTLARCSEIIESRTPTQHVSINAAKLVAMRRDERLREIVAGCGLASADGQSIVWAARLLGRPLPERVAGIDLMHALLAVAESRGWRVYFLGARQEVLDIALERLRDSHPNLIIAGAHHGYFGDSESGAICETIRHAKPDILFVAISSPRKEYWLAEHGEELGVSLAMGVGGSIDVVAGITRRAPVWMQRAGLEWFFRFLQEPRRMWRRYLSTNLQFAALVTRELVKKKWTPAPERERR